MTHHVYFDHNATTPLDEHVLAAMLPYLRDCYGNASSRHEYGTQARKAVNRAREQVAALIDVQPAQIIFTSGGTESNNAFIKGAAGMLKTSQIVVSAIEHPCVAKPAAALARAGWKMRKLATSSAGRVEMNDLQHALTEPTGIVSIMLANNETGVVQDVARAAELGRAAGAWVHTDAVQALGKIAVDFNALNVHAMTLSAHKIYGPKGVGALVLDKRIEIMPLLSGGGHEQGLRSGTENVAGIVGFGAACELAQSRWRDLSSQLAAMREQFEHGLRAMDAVIFGAAAARLPNTSYFAIPGIDGETLVVELDNAGFALASGAACSSASTAPSATLLAMGVAPEEARSAVRFSLGRDNTPQQVDALLRALEVAVARFHHMTAMAV